MGDPSRFNRRLPPGLIGDPFRFNRRLPPGLIGNSLPV